MGNVRLIIKFPRVFCLRALLCLSLVGSGVLSFSGTEKLNFRRISLRDGLSQASVLSLLEDEQGFVWLGTYDGLNRYDGRHFQVFQFDPDDPYSLSDNSVTCLLHDRKKQLIVGTNNGLNHFNSETGGFRRFYHDPSVEKSLPHNQIRAMCLDTRGDVWIGTDGGVAKYNPRSETVVRITFSSEDGELARVPCRSLLKDRDGTIWVGTLNEGLFFYDEAAGLLRRFSLDDSSHPFGRNISALAQDRHGDFWLGSESNGLTRFDKGAGKITRYVNNPNDTFSLGDNDIRAIVEDLSGTIWVGTFGGGLNRFDPLRGGFVRHLHDSNRSASLSNNQVTAILDDSSGALWVGTFIGGVNRYKRNMVTFDLLSPSPTSGDIPVWSILEGRDDAIWFGGRIGLYRYNQLSNSWKHFGTTQSRDGLPECTVWSLFKGSSGQILLGTSKGLYLLDPESETFTSFHHDPDNPESLSSDKILNVFQDGRGYIWASTITDGLNCLDPSNGKVRRFKHDPDDPNSLGSNKPRPIFEDKTGVIWIGSEGGGLSRSDGSGKFKSFVKNKEEGRSISHNHVLSIIPDRRDTEILWLGTAGGLNRFEKSGVTKFWRKAQGMPNDYIYALNQDMRGYIWVSTNRGLVVFNPGTERFRGFDVRDGLPSNEFYALSSAYSKNGRMYFGSLAGIVSFAPRDYNVDPKPIPLVFTDLLLANDRARTRALDPTSPLEKVIDRVEKITLDHHQRMVGFDFTGLEFSAPWQCHYAYYMDGFDQDWIYTNADDTSATYTNLPAGDFVFRVKATNPDGHWNPDDLSLKLTVLSPLWLRPWAKFLYGLLTLFLLGLYGGLQASRLRRQRHISFQERQLKEQAQLMGEKDRATALRLEQQVKERTSAMITQEKMATLGMLSSGVAHELNNPNNFVYGGAQSLERSLIELRNHLSAAWAREQPAPEMVRLWEYLDDMEEELALVQRGAGRIRDVVSHMEQFVRKGEAYTRTNMVAGAESTVILVRSQYPETIFEVTGERQLFCLVRPGEINQIFLNLVLNACEAIERRREKQPGLSGHLTIHAEIQGELALMKFEDSGDGFTLEQSKHLFEAFYTTKIGSDAAGLGLFTSWQIINDHHGSITATSEPGLGSVFTLSLPLMKEKQV